MGELISLDNKSREIKYLCNKDKRLAKLISMIGPLVYETQDENPFEFLIHEIIEQMLSIKAGNKIFSRLVDLCDGKVTPQKIAELTNEQIKLIGTSSSKVSYIRNVTDAVLKGNLDFISLKSLNDIDAIRHLTSIKGIGSWTANMYLIFVLNRMDILPTNDAAFLQVYKWLYKTSDHSDKSIRKKCKKWKPYSSIAARYMYLALDRGLTQNEFHLFK